MVGTRLVVLSEGRSSACHVRRACLNLCHVEAFRFPSPLLPSDHLRPIVYLLNRDPLLQFPAARGSTLLEG
ncbi:hypothetical protein PAXRUDRAFT_238192 [Paxillus rubicundulus Ve08.2h10]|uniref:Uncharacterized protein n=1 Tax=Paxillus rubicundulus Ve08.2h10 TaxID=930991 RepID=A0A0D0DTM4_9AGAM|nr:hypothetical protein PAXRUDRAFT_238192 [Paxillus rubicundulus Ve08.2h10]